MFLLALNPLSFVSSFQISLRRSDRDQHDWYYLYEDSCKNLQTTFYDEINTRDNCIKVYRDSDCFNAFTTPDEIKPGTQCHADWGSCNLRNKVYSVSGCKFSA